MRAVLFFTDGRSIDQIATWPPKLRMTVPNHQGKTKEFRLVGGSWAPTSEVQLAVYREIVVRKHLTAHKPEVTEFEAWQAIARDRIEALNSVGMSIIDDIAEKLDRDFGGDR